MAALEASRIEKYSGNANHYHSSIEQELLIVCVLLSLLIAFQLGAVLSNAFGHSCRHSVCLNGFEKCSKLFTINLIRID